MAVLGVAPAAAATSNGKPAILGGEPVRKKAFPSWPKFDQTEDKALLEVLRSGKWGRLSGTAVQGFEKSYAELLGTRQAGLMQLKVADLMRDADLLPAVQSAADVMMRAHADKIAPLERRWIGASTRYGKV